MAYKLDFLLSGTDVHSLKMGKKSYFEEVVKHHKYHFLGELYTLLKPKEKELVGFEVHWTLYKGGVIPFDERLFTIHITAPYLRDDKVARYTDLVLSDQEFHEKIFRRLHLFENQMCHDTRAWEAFFIHLQKKGYVFTRSYVTELFGTLLNPWKKTQLNWHCRWIEFLQPTQKELLAHQPILFALLSSGNSSLINFAIKHIQKITNEPNFDFATFTECFPLCFATQKIAKSQLIGLNILEKHYKQQPPTNLNYRESLAVLFTVPDTKLQEKVATILTTYFSDKGLAEVVAPYQDYLKIPVFFGPTPIPSPEEKEDDHNYPPLGEWEQIVPPTSWEGLLFLLGDCLREQSPKTIELFFEGFNQLQKHIPTNAQEQLSPYLQQMDKHWGGSTIIPIVRDFLLRWLGGESPYAHIPDFLHNKLPYLAHKANALLEKLKEKNSLPFLSTPTHAPFYIEAETLIERILQYEEQGVIPDIDELVVACNRLLFKEVSTVAQEKAKLLKGNYASAIQYFLGLTDEVTPTEELLPLWTQITRIKHPDRVFEEFGATSAKDIPSVIKPFTIDFQIKEGSLEVGEWNNEYVLNYEPSPYPYIYYHSGSCRLAYGKDILYQCSINPHYPEAQISHYTNSKSKGKHSGEINAMYAPMQVIADEQLPIYHGGWLYVAVALLFEKSASRNLAADYIIRRLQTSANLNVLAHLLGKLLAENFAPISRFVEFLNIPTKDPKIKAFQKSVVEEYLHLVKDVAKKPTNHKKMVDFSLQ